MSSGRLVSILSLSVIVVFGIASAGPKKGDKKGAPAGAAKGSATGAAKGSATGSASGSAVADPAAGSAAGSAVQMTEDAPPSDMNGTDENPDAPHAMTTEVEHVTTVAPVKPRPVGYPIEEVLRPITLPANLSEVSIGPHVDAVSPYAGSDALRARYGITSQIQLGLTYVFAGIFHDPMSATNKLALVGGKAVGLDVTYLVQNWVGIRLGVPFYIDPVAFSIALGAPMKFVFGDKFAIGGLDDLLNIKISKFAPSFTSEYENAANAKTEMVSPGSESRGHLRFSTFGLYQYEKDLVLIGRFGLDFNDFATSKNDRGYGPATTFIRFGLDYSPRRYLDLGASIGFTDLSTFNSFGPAGYLALRI